MHALSTMAGDLEGISTAGDVYQVTDWAAGKLLKSLAASGGVSELLTGWPNPTDPGYAPEWGVLSFPQHTGDQVLFVRVKWQPLQLEVQW